MQDTDASIRNPVLLFAGVFITSTVFAGSPRSAQAQDSKEEAIMEEEGGVSASSDAPKKVSELSKREKQKFLTLVESGQEAFSKGQFENAIPFFRQARQILADPKLLARIALSYERSNQPKKAIEYYEQFLKEAPNSDKRGQVKRTIEDLKSQIQVTLSIQSSPEGAKVYLGDTSGEPRGKTPLEITFEPTGKTTKLVVQKSGFQKVERSLDLEPGVQKEMSVALQPTESGGGGGNTAAIVLASVGGAATAGAVTSGILFNQANSTFNKRNNNSNFTEQEAKNARERAVFYQTLLIASGAAAAASLGTATVLWLTGNDKNEKASNAPNIRLAPTVRRKRAGVVLELAF